MLDFQSLPVDDDDDDDIDQLGQTLSTPEQSTAHASAAAAVTTEHSPHKNNRHATFLSAKGIDLWELITAKTSQQSRGQNQSQRQHKLQLQIVERSMTSNEDSLQFELNRATTKDSNTDFSFLSELDQTTTGSLADWEFL